MFKFWNMGGAGGIRIREFQDFSKNFSNSFSQIGRKKPKFLYFFTQRNDDLSTDYYLYLCTILNVHLSSDF